MRSVPFRTLKIRGYLLNLVWLVSWPVAQSAVLQNGARPVVNVADFLPKGYVTDGSVSYMRQVQQALDVAAQQGAVVVFPPMTYRIDRAEGLRVHSNTTLFLRGATFQLADSLRTDGQAFYGHDVTDVTFIGGTIVGRRDAWPDAVNIAGIRISGRSARLRFRDLTLMDLSSNGIGLFGHSSDAMIEDVWIENCVMRNCCNKYIDYLQPHPGPVPGSRREDQGAIAMYFVSNFVVSGCTLERSRSDGTHFYRCRDGRFVNNRVLDSHMGGYFVETCEAIVATGNIIRGNGSRGVTIERGSRNCVLANNIIENSGREGLWAPESIGLVVTGNLFRYNGRKDHGDLDGEIMINKSAHDPSRTPWAEDYLIANNIFYTSAHQGAAIRIADRVRRIVVRENTFIGATRKIVIDRSVPDRRSIVVGENVGAKLVIGGEARERGSSGADGAR